jgi:hypothetical protein
MPQKRRNSNRNKKQRSNNRKDYDGAGLGDFLNMFKKKTVTRYDRNSYTYNIIGDLIKLSLVLYALIPNIFVDIISMEPYTKIPEIEIEIIPYIDSFMNDFDNDFRNHLFTIVSSPLMDQLKKDYYRDSKQLILRMLRNNFPQYQRDNINKIKDALSRRKGTLLNDLDKHACDMLFKNIAKVPQYQLGLITPQLEILINNASDIIVNMNAVCTSKPLPTSYEDIDPSLLPPAPLPPTKINQQPPPLPPTKMNQQPPQLPPRPMKPFDFVKLSYETPFKPFSGPSYRAAIGGSKKRRKSSKQRRRK